LKISTLGLEFAGELNSHLQQTAHLAGMARLLLLLPAVTLNQIYRRFMMRNILLRVSLALAVTVSVLTLPPCAKAQQADPQQPSAAPQQTDPQTQGDSAHTGTIVKVANKLVLKDLAGKVNYELDDQDKAKQFEGKRVKVTGKLDMNTNLIHVEDIEALDL
jgi:uncharacterized protein DUF5818